MTDERIQKIKSAVEGADHISPEKKAELLAVLAKLKPAIAKVAKTHEQEAESISRFVEASAHEAAIKETPGRSRENLVPIETVCGKIRGLSSGADCVRHRIFRVALQLWHLNWGKPSSANVRTPSDQPGADCLSPSYSRDAIFDV